MGTPQMYLQQLPLHFGPSELNPQIFHHAAQLMLRKFVQLNQRLGKQQL